MQMMLLDPEHRNKGKILGMTLKCKYYSTSWHIYTVEATKNEYNQVIREWQKCFTFMEGMINSLLLSLINNYLNGYLGHDAHGNTLIWRFFERTEGQLSKMISEIHLHMGSYNNTPRNIS